MAREAKKRGGSGVYQRKESGLFHVDLRVNGARYTSNEGFGTRREAEEFAALVRTEARRNPPAPPGPAAKGDRTLKQGVDDYIEQHVRHLKGAKSRKALLRAAEKHLGGGIMLSQIDKSKLIELRDKRLDDDRWDLPAQGKVKKSTTNMMLYAVECMLNYACDVWGIPKRHTSLKNVALKTPKPKTRVFTLEEQDRILEHLCPEDQAICKVMLRTTLRRNNVVCLKWEEVDLENDVLNVVVKGDEPEAIPITPEMRAIIEARRGNHPIFVFSYEVVERHHNPWQGWREAGTRIPVEPDTFYRRFRAACKKAGIKGKPHDCRHTGITRIVRERDIHVAQKVAKHAKLSSTERYAHLDVSDERKAMMAVERKEQRMRAKLAKKKAE